ncbi:TetR family transcriptional regulator [Nocardia xishanensis]
MRSREAALAAARELLIEQGLAGLTHGAVAARSGISRATLTGTGRNRPIWFAPRRHCTSPCRSRGRPAICAPTC